MQRILRISAASIASASHAQLVGPSTAHFEHFAFDSRRLNSGRSSCFIALQTPTADGHAYIDDAIACGAKVVVCRSAEPWKDHHPNIAFVVHPEPLDVLRSWAATTRQSLSGKVLALTGSNGKTVVKEWMMELAGTPQDWYRTPGSFNSELGVPITLCGIGKEHRIAIIEVGIDRPGTMASLEELVRPDFGVFTTLGDAHDEHFESADQKFIEKWKLFANVERIALSRVWYDKAVALELPLPDALIWGPGEQLDPKDFPELPFQEGHHLENAMSAIAGALLLGASKATIREGLARLQPLEMRMQLHPAQSGGYLLEDTYSSDLESLRWALEELVSSAPHLKKWAVLSHLSTPQATERARSLVESYGLQRVWWISAPEDVPDLVAEFQGIDLRDVTVLVKGQRRFKLERFSATLRQQYHSTWAEVNLGAMRRNLQKFKAVLHPGTKIMAMVKAASYGAGTLEVARFLQEVHVDYLGVAYAQEALNLRAQGVTMPILVLNVEPEQIPMLAGADCEVELFDIDQLSQLHQLPETALLKVHLKINTGMNRLGFAPSKIEDVVAALASDPRIEVVGTFTHLAAADQPEHDAFTREQLQIFEKTTASIRKAYPNVLAHALNTHGIHRFPEYQNAMVRLGIGLYGVGHYSGIEILEEVLSWRCKISQIATLQPGDSIGYGRGFVAEKPMRYATLPVGYADGFSRGLSNGVGAVYIRGKRCEVLGRVCMDMVMVDIGDLQVNKGDEVELIGPHQSASDLAKAQGTIAYEVLTGIGPRVPRFYVKD